jgi:hypothetical protein
MRRLAALAVTVAAAIALGGWAYAETQPADPSVDDSPAAAKAGRRPGPAGLKRAIHGELLVPNGEGGYRTVVFDRGRITAIDGDSITLERGDGTTVTVALNGATEFNGTPREQLKAGDPVMVVQSDGSAIRVLSKGARAELKDRRQGAREKRRQGVGNEITTLNV